MQISLLQSWEQYGHQDYVHMFALQSKLKSKLQMV